jgi:hypothetical protein
VRLYDKHPPYSGKRGRRQESLNDGARLPFPFGKLSTKNMGSERVADPRLSVEERYASRELPRREIDGDIRKALIPTFHTFLQQASRTRTAPSLRSLREEHLNT